MDKHLLNRSVHSKSLKGIQQHADIGRIPMLDYACEFAQGTGQPMPESCVALIQFLCETEKIKDDKECLTRIHAAYTKFGIQSPIGIEDLPIWWTPSIINELNMPESKVVMNWNSVFLQGAFLDLQYPDPIDMNHEDWPIVGAALMRLHQNLIPGPFTPEAQLEEFF